MKGMKAAQVMKAMAAKETPMKKADGRHKQGSGDRKGEYRRLLDKARAEGREEGLKEGWAKGKVKGFEEGKAAAEKDAWQNDGSLEKAWMHGWESAFKGMGQSHDNFERYRSLQQHRS